MARNVVLALVLAFVCVLGFLTVAVLVRQGFDILVGLSLVFLLVMGFGALGALTSSDD